MGASPRRCLSGIAARWTRGNDWVRRPGQQIGRGAGYWGHTEGGDVILTTMTGAASAESVDGIIIVSSANVGKFQRHKIHTSGNLVFDQKQLVNVGENVLFGLFASSSTSLCASSQRTSGEIFRHQTVIAFRAPDMSNVISKQQSGSALGKYFSRRGVRDVGAWEGTGGGYGGTQG